MHATLAHRFLPDAKIQAYKRSMLGGLGVGFRGGLVLDEQDNLLRQWRNSTPFDSFDRDAVYRRRIEGEYNYGGPYYDHFGHFMAEMVHRIVPSLLLNGGGPFLFVTHAANQPSTSFETLPTYARDVLALLGLGPRDFHLITKNSVVERLFVVEQGSALGAGPKSGYLDDLRDYIEPRLDTLHRWDTRPKKVYVSRAGMSRGRFLGEHYLEAQLAGEGFSIIRPETLPVSVQMDTYRKSEVLIFAEGSSCHGVELLGTASLRRCYLLVRRDHVSARFERVLRPRAADFAASNGHPFIGTAFDHPRTGQPIRRHGMNLLRATELLDFFRSHDIARLPTFDEKEYLRVAGLDLLRYHGDDADPRSSELACKAGMLDKFHAAMRC